MPYKDIRIISEGILGDKSSTTLIKKVLLVMYYAELLAINFVEIEDILKKHGRERISKIFYLEANFVEHIYTLFLTCGIDTILPKLYARLLMTHELLDQNELLKSCSTPKFVQ